MLMFPKVQQILAIDPNLHSLAYLYSQLKTPSPSWQLFWDYFSLQPSLYHGNWHEQLDAKLTTRKGRIENLKENTYNLASMFFVAESITTSLAKFSSYCAKFVSTIKPGGYAVVALMENPTGYRVGGAMFPAVSINQTILREVFTPLLSKVSITRIKASPEVLRPGYSGMLVLTGQK